MKLRPKIDPHDYETKKGHVVRFLNAGDKVKITIMFRGREQHRPEPVQPHGRPTVDVGDDGDGEGEADRDDDGAEPEARAEGQLLGDQAGERVAEADAGDGGDGQQPDDAGAVLAVEGVARDRHGEGDQPEADAHQAPAEQQQRERAGHGGEHAPDEDRDERAEHGPAPVPAVAEAPEGGGGDGAHEQADGERPLGGRERHVGVVRDGRHERGAQAADDRRHHPEVDQDGDQPSALHAAPLSSLDVIR